MATAESDDLIMVQVTKNSKVYSARMSRSLLNMINSPDCDPTLREEVINAATASEPFSSSAPSKSKEEEMNPEPFSSSAPSKSKEEEMNPEPFSSSAPSKSKEEEMNPDQLIHLWTSAEEKALIDIRGEFDEQFNKSQRHDVLWKEVTKKMIGLGIYVTNVQVKNKWNKLKKDYRKAVDENNNTGNNPTKFKYYEEFNQIYGNRASTKPMVVYDSSNKRPLTTDTHSASLDLPKKQKKEPLQRSTQNSQILKLWKS